MLRLLKRLAWRLVREEVGAAILAAEQRNADVQMSGAIALAEVNRLARTVHDAAVLRDQQILASIVQVLNDAGIRCHVETADGGFEVIPPGKLN